MVPDGIPTSLGAGIFAQLAAGIFPSIEEAQRRMCLPFRTVLPQPAQAAVYERLYPLYRSVYFAFGSDSAAAEPPHKVLATLRDIAAQVRSSPVH